MNKIYRTVYNETTGTWVAVCETAKTHTKSSGSVVDNATESVSGSLKAYSLTAVTAAAALLSPLMANQAQAADVLCKNDLTGVVSAKAACETGESLVESLAVGSNAQVNSNRSFAFGNSATVGANSVDSVALGSNSQVGPGANNAFAAVGGQAKQNSSISIGVRSIADGEGAIAFGSGIPTGNNSGSYAKGEGSIAIGKRAEAIGANVTYEGKAGNQTLPQQVTEDQHGHQYSYNRDVDGYTGDAAQMVAIGDNASAYGNQSIAIGGNSVASGYASISIGGDDIGDLKNSNTHVTDYLKNDLYKDLNDNGFTVPTAITNLRNNQPWANLTTSIGSVSTAFGIKAVAEGDLSNAYGVSARSVGKNSNAFGTVSFAGGDESIAFGTASKTAMKTGNYATAIGYMSQVDGSKSVALGYKNKVTGNSSTAVGQNNTITGNNSGAFGDPNNISGNNSYAAGNNNTIATDNTFVLGNNVTNTLENSVYLGAGSTTATTKGGAGLNQVQNATVGGITYGGFAGQEAQGIVSVGTDSSARRIQNVAAGAINANSTDAINGSQLYAVLPKYTDDGQGNATSVTIGDKTYNFAQGGSGGSTTVVGQGSIKVVPTTTGASQYTVSIPVVANSDGNAATAANVANSSTGSVAMGENAKIGNNVADSIAIGKDASVSNLGTGNVVIGAGSSTPNRAENMVVIGTGLNITQGTPNAVVIGSGSAASSAVDSDLNPNKFTFRSTSLNQANEGGVNDGANATVATFNVGAKQGQLRQIKGVAAGLTEKGSTDAVNGDQLYTVALAVDNMGYSLAGGGTVDAQGNITGGTGVLGESFTVNTDDAYGTIGTIIGKNIAGTGADNIEDAIKQSRTEVQKEDGSPITVTGNTTDGKTTYTVGVETQGLTINENGSVNDVPDNSATGGTLNKNKLVTAGDVVNVVNNTFWVASDGTKDATTGAENTTQVKASNKVTIQGENGVKVALDANSKTYTVSGLTVSGSTPATGTSGNATATELTDADGNKYNIGGADSNTVTDLTVNGGNPAGNTTGNLKLTKDESNPDNPIYDVSLNNVVTVGNAQNGDKPVTIDGTKGEINFTNNEGKITNVASHLKDQVAGDTTINSANTPDQFANAKNEAATVGDVLNAGWNLKVGGQDKDFVQHGDTIDFGNGKGTTAQYNNGVISFDIAKAGNSVVNTTVTNSNSGKVTGGKADQYWDSKQVQDAINKAGWKVGVGATANAQDELINAGDRVGLVAGNGVKIDQTGSNFTIATDYVFKDGSGNDITQQGGDVATITTKDENGGDVTYNFGDGNDNTVTGVTVNGGQDATTNAADGGNLKLTETTDQNGNPTYDISLNDEVDLSDKGSLKVGGDQQGSPVTNVTAGNIDFGDTQGSITNVASHLKDQVAGDTTINSANTPDQFANAKNEAATVGDVLNAGWNLKVGGKDADFVQHGDTVEFGNSDTVNAAYDNGVIKFNANTTPLTVNNTTGVVNAPTNPNSLVTAGDVQTAINNAGWFVNSGAVAGRGTNSGAAKTLVKAGEEVKFIAGDGMNIVQNGKEFTFNAKIVDTNGKQLPVDDNGNYVVRIVNNGNPVGIDDKGNFNTGGGGSGSGKPFTITGNDADGNTSTTTIDGVDNTPGSGVTFVGDENVKVIKQPTQGGDGTDVAVGLQNKVNVGGTSDGTANGTPNAGSVTIDGSNQNGGSITFNNTTPDNSVKVNGDSGSLNLGQGANNNPVNITNVNKGADGSNDAVNVAQIEDVVGVANKDANGVVKTTGSKGEEYTLKTYNVHGQTEYLTNNVVEAVSKMNEQGIKFFHVNDGTQTPVAQAQNKVDSQAFGKNAVAIGVGSIAEGEDSIAIGTLNNVSGKGSGAIGDPNEVSGSGSYVLGNNNKVATNNTFVLGNEVTNTTANSVFLGDKSAANAKGAGADGKVSSATVGDITYSGFAGEKSVGMVSVGNASEVRRVSGVAAGEISATSTDAINGSQLHSALSNSGVYVTGNGAAPTDANLVKLGNKAGALNFVDGNGTTAVVKGNTVTFDTVPGYADGIKAGDNVVFNYEDNTDAAGNPLYVTTTGGTTTDATDPNVKVDANGNPVKQQTTVISAKQPDLRPLQHQVEQVENNAYAGVAQAMATAGLPQAYLPGKSMVAVAGGYYKGEQGYALGVSSISDSGNWVFKATASGNSRNNFGGTVGAGYQW